MTKAELAAKMQDAGAWLPGKTVKLDFGDDGTILLDGANNLVSEDDGAADTTIKVSWDDWQAMAKGELDGMTAFMTGKLKVEGDMSNAMQLQGVLAKLRGVDLTVPGEGRGAGSIGLGWTPACAGETGGSECRKSIPMPRARSKACSSTA